MGVEVYGGGGGGVSAQAQRELTRFNHQRATIGAGLAADMVYHGLASGIAGTPFTNLGTIPTRGRTDQRMTWTMNPTLVAGSGHTYKGTSVNGTASEQLSHFRDTVPAVELLSPLGQPFAMCAQAWIRKANNVNQVWARQFFGFGCFNLSPIGASAQHPRVGLIGDGNVGFRLGSVHCPDGLAAGQSAAAAIDAGFVQPATLLNPGLNWFHIRVKMVPAVPGGLPAVGIYLDGALIVSFFTVTNFPRGQLAATNNYAQVEAAAFTDFDGATQLNGLVLSDWETWYDTDLSL